MTKNAKLTKEDVINIRLDFDSGKYKKVELARKYKLTPTHVGYIIARKAWSNI